MNVTVIVGHPRPNSFCHALAGSYAESISRLEDVNLCIVDLARLQFDPNLRELSPDMQVAEPLLARARQQFLAADHVVVVFPTWWGTMPAVLKGFLDRILAPGEAFEEVGENYRGLLSGKTAHLITTMDAPGWVYRFVYKSAGVAALKNAVFRFCGFESVRTTRFDRIKHRSDSQRQAALAGVAREASHAARWRRRALSRAAVARWIRAVRLQFYPMTLLAFSVGALLTLAGHAHANVPCFLLAYAALFLIEVASVFANEVGDAQTDSLNRNYGPFTGGSRVLVTGGLGVGQLKRAVAYSIAAAAVLAGAATVVSDKPAALAALFATAFALGIGYTLSPLRLVYRTLGEINVAFTHSFLMVLAGALSQPAPLPAVSVLLVSSPLFLAVLCAITLAGIPDRDADRLAHKKTIAVKYGIAAGSTVAIVAAVTAAALATLLTWRGIYPIMTWAMIAGAWLHCAICVRAITKRAHECARIDSVLALALSFILWFCVPQLVTLLNGKLS